ncbi:MAG: ABC transporter permease [Atopobiaceae bacterium]|nr:ABC transporter permease [Atopobiaceae bacterium]
MEHHTHISAEHRLLDLHLDELWRYRDLVWLLTKRSFVVTYKQTVLGPLWLLLSPLLTSIVYMVLFGNIAHLSTGGVPQLLFYLLGTALWSYFSTCVTANATTFVDNANLFGKVYFPRLAVPVSRMLGALIHLGIQMILVLGLIGYYTAAGAIRPTWELWPTIPLALLVMGGLGMGCGVVISSLTTRYRDLSVLVGFGVSLWMYLTPVVYPLESVTGPLRSLILANPVSAQMEYLRLALLGVGDVSAGWLAGSALVSCVILAIGVVVFTKVERTFMDTI